MNSLVLVCSVSIGCLLILGVVGSIMDYVERQAYERKRKHVDPPEKVDPWWFGDPPDGDTFP